MNHHGYELVSGTWRVASGLLLTTSSCLVWLQAARKLYPSGTFAVWPD